MMLEHAVPAGISILIENHGGVSNDADWLVALMKEVNSKYFGVLPDWREPGGDFDNVGFLEKTLPYAGGMSFRNQPTGELNEKMIRMTYDADSVDGTASNRAEGKYYEEQGAPSEIFA